MKLRTVYETRKEIKNKQNNFTFIVKVSRGHDFQAQPERKLIKSDQTKFPQKILFFS